PGFPHAPPRRDGRPLDPLVPRPPDRLHGAERLPRARGVLPRLRRSRLGRRERPEPRRPPPPEPGLRRPPRPPGQALRRERGPRLRFVRARRLPRGQVPRERRDPAAPPRQAAEVPLPPPERLERPDLRSLPHEGERADLPVRPDRDGRGTPVR